MPGDMDGEEAERYSEKVCAALESLTRDELCRPDLDLTAHINQLFPSEQSLSQLDSVMATVEAEMLDLDLQLATLVEGHAKAADEGETALRQARGVMDELGRGVRAIRIKTESSENMVQEMTRDMKLLDVAKRNLTASITTLHHLHILLTGVQALTTCTAARRYSEIAARLPAVLNVLQLFDAYMGVAQLKAVADQVEQLKQRLGTQLAADLRQAFSGMPSSSVTDMCRVASVLDSSVQADFCRWYIDQQLSEYHVLYADNEDIAWIDKIDMRYRWFVNKLTEFERSGASALFPADWQMGRRLTKEFCSVTRTMLGRLLGRRSHELHWKLLAHAINHTQMFETLLCRRFPATIDFDFDKAIWSLFDAHMGVFVAAQERALCDFVDQTASRIRSGAEKAVRETSAHAYPLPSSADLFLLLKRIITDSAKLCTKPDQLLRELIPIFRRCLRGYGHGCLTAFLPQTTANVSTGSGLLQNLLREETTIRLSIDQRFLTCCLLATADWCAETTMQLQERLKDRLQGLDLNQEMELFYSISNNALVVLVNDLECACDAALQAMTKMNWSNVESVGDESPYVASIRGQLRSAIPLLRDFFAERRKYFAHLCLKLAVQFVTKFLGALFRCRSIGITGAEQLLLDTHSLKTFLLGLPSIDSAVIAKPPTSYTKCVTKAMNKAEMVLKVVMSEIDSPEAFLANYARLLPESDSSELQKILEIKGVRRSEQTPLLQLYRSRVEAVSEGSSSLSTVVSIATDGLADSSIKRLENLVKKKL